MKNKYLQLKDVLAYKIAFHLSNYVWAIIIKIDWFAKRHMGSQFVEAVYSIFTNIAEGFGRYHKKDKIKFYHHSQNSMKKTFDWHEKLTMLSDNHKTI